MLFYVALAVAAEHTDSQLIENVQKTYRELNDFSCNGRIKTTQFINDYPNRKTITEFSIKLKKPNYYVIKWKIQNPEEQKVMGEGAVWNDGKKAYYYLKILEAYYSFSSDEVALSVATGDSSGVAYKIPSLFFNSLFDQNNWLSSLKNLTFDNSNQDIAIIRGVDITIDSLIKTEVQVTKKTNLISKNTKNYITMENPRTKIKQLTEERADYIKKSKMYAEFAKIFDPSDTENDGSTLVEMYDERIEKLSNLPQYNKKIRTKIEEEYFSLSKESIPRDKFQFQVPPGVKFKGNELEKLLEKTRKL